ncbi:uncharacterized protein LOC114298964 isoform X2 [Camellia sinensis]|uniref:uncharacterized protein LOC114298964 isoform X2 n=1 Tax=Camellia sinensis TaxID=4442 RepID=UPI0010358F36|nr:uncharacterized protein LOC114298964 isoform X2 [Camellia sinensis]
MSGSDGECQSSGMLSKNQLLHLFDRFAFLTSQPEVKKRIADAVDDKQEAVAVTTAIQEEIFLEMGVGKSVLLDIVGEQIKSFIQVLIFRQLSPKACVAQPDVCASDPRFGLACLGRVNMAYENDQDLMIRFYGFVVKEELACEEAELGPDNFAGKMEMQLKLQEQLEMLKHMRKFHLDDQSTILENLHQQMEAANFDDESSVFSVEQIQDIVRRRVTPVFRLR